MTTSDRTAGRWMPALRDVLLLLPPFALAAYPILYAWGAYPTLTHPLSVYRALVAVTIATAVLLTLARVLCRSWVSGSVGLSLTYVAVLVYLAGQREFYAFTVRPPLTMSYVSLCAAAILALGRESMRGHHRNICRVLIVVTFVLLSEVIAPILPAAPPVWAAEAQQITDRPIAARTGAPGDARPDIYYIVLDAYGRRDVFSRAYGFDNGPFLDALRAQGFYVADRARSNYVQTDLSLASALNMTYLDALARGRERKADRAPARYLIRHNAVARALRAAGYEFVFISSDYASTTSLADVDECECRIPFPGSFELLLARGQRGAFSWVEPRAYVAHARHVLSEIDALARQADRRANTPRFVFAHIVAPHPPFVFARDGSLHAADRPYSTGDASDFRGTPEEYRLGYRDQLLFLSARLLPVLTRIVRDHEVPPIVILQGDHGPGLGLSWHRYLEDPARNRAGILAAFHVDARTRARLYPEITPVNFFRAVLSDTLGADLPRLPDASYYSPWFRPFAFTRIPPDPADAPVP